MIDAVPSVPWEPTKVFYRPRATLGTRRSDTSIASGTGARRHGLDPAHPRRDHEHAVQLGGALARDDWSPRRIWSRVSPKYPFGDESAILMPDQHFGLAPGVTVLFRKRYRATDGLCFAGVVPRKASPSLDDLPAKFLVHHDVSRIEHEFLRSSIDPL